MRLLISGATTTVEHYAREVGYARFLGTMVTPATGNRIDRMVAMGLPWCVDNAAFNIASFDGDA